MSSEPYFKRVSYQFKINDEWWEVVAARDTAIAFEEIRKNGQEDTHMGGVAELVNGVWILDKLTREQISMYSAQETVDDIEAFFNAHGPPSEREETSL